MKSVTNPISTKNTFDHCKSIASAIGQAADKGMQFTVSENDLDKFTGAVQVGEYLFTGKVPESALVQSVIQVNRG